MTTSATHCKLSQLSLAIQNMGDACVCNKNVRSFIDNSTGKRALLYETGLKEMWDSDTRKEIISSLDKGERHPSCQACWNDEDAGVKSTRQIYNQSLATVESLTDQPRILIIKPSNVCNMGCRTCQPATSSGLYQDFYKLETQQNTFTGTFKEYTSQFETIRDGFGRDNLAVWDTFEKWIPGLVFIDIYGGEPMLAPAMWERIISASAAGDTANTDVQIHTNGTIWNQDYVDCLPKFKSTRLVVSIDAVDPAQLEYVRNGVDADELFKNLEKYVTFSKQHPNVNVSICFTVSIFNIWYFTEILEGLSAYQIDLGVNVVYTPEQYDFRHLPQSIKNTLIERFTNWGMLNSNKSQHTNKMINLLKHNIPGCNILFPKFWHELRALDNIRAQRFEEVMPEFYAALIADQPWLLDVK